MKNYFVIICFIILGLLLSCEKEEPVYPPVLGDSIAEVTSSEIVLKSSFKTSDSGPVSECGFVICRDTIFNEYTKVMSKNVSSNFSCTIENKDSGKYYAKSYAINKIGTGYSKLFSFEVLHDNDTVSSGNLPTVQTLDATNVGSSSTTLNGNVISDGGANVTSRGFVYGTSSDNFSCGEECGSGTGDFNKTITALSPETTYYYKAFAVSNAGRVFGEVKQFTTTTINAPTVSTVSATNITSNSATLNGNVTSNGGTTVTSRGFVYGTSPSNFSQNVQSGSGTGSYTKSISGLVAGTTYYFKAYVTNSVGTSYGEVKQFTTTVIYAPTVSTVYATSITTNSATLNGNVTSDGGATVTSRGFVYGTSSSNLSQNVQSGSGTGSYNKSITGLAAGTTYYFKAYAVNNVGTAYGEVKQFKTTEIYAPTVYTIPATSITTNSVTLNGNVTSDGGATVTSRGFVYGTSSDNLSQNVQSGSGTGSYNKSITGLVAGTTYYFKAYATNVAGTEYGELKQFSTGITAVSNPTGYINGYGYVDLGLPSGTLWAVYNVGASNPEDYGNYYAWGEIGVKQIYNWGNYQYCNGSFETLTKYCFNSSFGYNGYTDDLITLESSDDAATVNWGTSWRTPTITELNELMDNCVWLRTALNGVNGVVFTGPNGCSIFLPAAGYYNYRLNDESVKGYYWSNSLYNSPDVARELYVDSIDICTMHSHQRFMGQSVRAVVR